MALTIKNLEVERLVEEVVRMTGENKTQAIRQALEERRNRLVYRQQDVPRPERLRRFLEGELWPLVPPEELGRRLDRDEEDALLGYGEDGV